MADSIPDLWPQDIGEASLQTPVTILRQEAALLGEKTNQLVTAEVTTQSQGQTFLHSFVIVAPALDNYKYELFKVQHGISFYPMTVIVQGGGNNIGSQAQFIEILRMIFTSPNTKNIVQSLIAQIRR